MLSTLVRPMPAFLVRSPLTIPTPFSTRSRAVLQAGKGFGDTPKPKPPREAAENKAPRKVCVYSGALNSKMLEHAWESSVLSKSKH